MAIPFEEKKISLVPTKPGENASPTTTERVYQIADKIIEGMPRYRLIEWIKKRYSIKDVQAKRYYDAALKYLLPSEDELEDFQAKMQAKLLARYEELYQDAVSRHSTKIAKEILDSMAKIYGIGGNNSVKIRDDVNGNKEIEISFS